MSSSPSSAQREEAQRAIEQQWHLMQQQQQQRASNNNKTAIPPPPPPSAGHQQHLHASSQGKTPSKNPRMRVSSVDRKEVLGHSYHDDEEGSSYGSSSLTNSRGDGSSEGEISDSSNDSSSYFSAVLPENRQSLRDILQLQRQHTNGSAGLNSNHRSPNQNIRIHQYNNDGRMRSSTSFSSTSDQDPNRNHHANVASGYQVNMNNMNTNGYYSYNSVEKQLMDHYEYNVNPYAHGSNVVDYEYSSASDHSMSGDDDDQVYDVAAQMTKQYLDSVREQKQLYGGGDSHRNGGGNNGKEYVLYTSRWDMLLWMSLLNMLSDWTCYSIAPITSLVDEEYPTPYSKELLVTLFLTANALVSLCEPWILSKIGLRHTVLLGAVLLCAGSILKGHSAYNLNQEVSDNYLYTLPWGFFITGLSQPLYQCTPAVLSSSWFAEDERTMATGVALNSNQIGIGLSFFFGALFVTKPEHVCIYFSVLSCFSLFLVIMVYFRFEDGPPSPPSSSAKVLRGSLFSGTTEEDDEPSSIVELLRICFQQRGFTHALLAFTASAIVINTLSTNFEALLTTSSPDHDKSNFAAEMRHEVAFYGGGFQAIVMCASLVMGKSADVTRAYYSVILVLLVVGAFLLAECSVALDPLNGFIEMKYLLLILGFFIGPLQPVSTEMGVDLTYPRCSENTVLVIQQLFANGFSSLVIPIFESLKDLHFGKNDDDDDDDQLLLKGDMIDDNDESHASDVPPYYYSFYLLILIHALTTIYFSTFRGKYKRYEHEITTHQQQQQENFQGNDADKNFVAYDENHYYDPEEEELLALHKQATSQMYYDQSQKNYGGV